MYYGGFSLNFTKHGFLITPVMFYPIPNTGVEQRLSGYSLWDGLEKIHPVPPYPVLAEQQERTHWEPLSFFPCTKPAGAELFNTSHPGCLASNKCLKCRTQNLNLWTISHCSCVLDVSPEHLEESQNDQKKKGEMFLNNNQFIWDTQLDCTPGIKASKRLCSENPSADDRTTEFFCWSPDPGMCSALTTPCGPALRTEGFSKYVKITPKRLISPNSDSATTDPEKKEKKLHFLN